MRLGAPVLALCLGVVLSPLVTERESFAEAPHASDAREPVASGVARRDPPELSGCNSRCRRVYCAESGSGRTYLCRCDCPK